MIALLVVTDGRPRLIDRAIASARKNLQGPITHRVIFDDTGDDARRALLRALFPDFAIIGEPTRQGFAGAITAAWRYLAQRPERFVFHLEDDFTFNQPVDLVHMAAALDTMPHLVQLALRRQPWNDLERLAGGVIEQQPDAYTAVDAGGICWLEHQLFFTTNPSLYRRSLCEAGWPTKDQSEGRFTFQLLQRGSPEASAEDLRFGYWGKRGDAPWVEHIGLERAGKGY